MRSEEYAYNYMLEENHWWFRSLHRSMFSFLDSYRPNWREERILDAGCGTGKILEMLGAPDRNIGIDLAEESLKFCHKRGLTNVKQGDICDLPFNENSFEAVICASVLYHEWVPEPKQALGEFQKVLVPDGILFVELPAYDFLSSPHDDAVLTARRFTTPAVRELFSESGFEILRLSHRLAFALPLAFMARTLRLAPEGRDFSASGKGSHNVFNKIMNMAAVVENRIMRRVDLPVGTSIYCVAKKI